MTDEKMTQGRFVTNLALAKVSGYIDDNKDEFLQKIADNVYPLVDSILAGAEQQVEHEVKKQIKDSDQIQDILYRLGNLEAASQESLRSINRIESKLVK